MKIYKMLSKMLMFLCLTGFCIQTQAQYNNHLVLRKGYKVKHNYLTGDSIRFQLSHHSNPIIGLLEAIGEDFIVVRGQVFLLTDINTVFHYRQSFNFKAGGKILQIAAPGFLGITAFTAIYDSLRPILSVSNLITSGSLFLGGLLLKQLQVRKYVLGKRFFLRIVPSDPETMMIK